ncbi:MAG: hypothetical protein HY371_16495, partial [Devosia nanyangense]|nr:hypothetical protein [Devosia nanyangense]
ILFAHVILDGAFAARVLLARLDALPSARLKTGQSLALSAWQRFAIIDWPVLRGALPGLAAIIFLLAFTSFPIVLLLGGGPANQTLEVAIYSAVRLDFDLKGAVNLALVQIAACSIVILIASALAPVPTSLGPSGGQTWSDSRRTQALQWLILLICLVAFALPLLSVLADGIGLHALPVLTRPSFWTATITSLVIGIASAVLCIVFALLLIGAAGAGYWAWREGYVDPAAMFGQSEATADATAPEANPASVPATEPNPDATGPGNTVATAQTAEPTQELKPDDRLSADQPSTLPLTTPPPAQVNAPNADDKSDERLPASEPAAAPQVAAADATS